MNIGETVTEVMQLVDVSFTKKFGYPNRINIFLGETGTVFRINSSRKAITSINVGDSRIVAATVKSINVEDVSFGGVNYKESMVVVLEKPWVEEVEAA